MNKRLLKVLSMLLLWAILLPALPAASAVQANYPAYVVHNTMPVYKSPNVLSPVLGIMAYGEDVRVLAWQNEWLRVQNAKGEIGYCKFGGLSTHNPNKLNIDAWVKEAGAYVFAKPSASSKTLGTVRMGQYLKALAMTPDQQWVRVSNGSRIGYIATGALSKTPTGFHGALNRVWIISNGAVSVSKTRDGWDEVGIVSHGQYYELLGKQSGYAYIRNTKGKTGWIQEGLVSSNNPNTLSQTMYAQVGGNVLYSNAIKRGSAAALRKGEAVKVVAVTPDGSWYRIQKNGKYYYVDSVLLAPTKAPEGGRILQCDTDVLTVYKTSTISPNVVAYLTRGERVQLIGTGANGGLQVRTQSGIVGYVPGALSPV